MQGKIKSTHSKNSLWLRNRIIRVQATTRQGTNASNRAIEC